MPDEQEVDEESPEEKPATRNFEQELKEKEEALATAKKELEDIKIKQNRHETPKAQEPSSYSMGSFSEKEWEEVETQYGVDRKTVLLLLNTKAQAKREAKDAVAALEVKIETDREINSRAQEDPLFPKYRKEVLGFIADIPQQMLETAEGRKKWIEKAFDYGKKTVKHPGQRSSAGLSVPGGDEKLDKKTKTDYTQEDEEVFTAHGIKAEDYEKIKHPRFPGILVSERPQPPRFNK